MWEAIVGLMKGLFGGKGAMQIGKDNQAVTGSTTGQNSPVVTAGRDVHLNMPPVKVADGEAEVFAELEEMMPDFLGDLRKELAEHPLIRDIIVLDKKSIAYNWPDDHLMFSEDENPGARSKMRVFENYGLVKELKDGFAYRVSERLAKYLRKN